MVETQEPFIIDKDDTDKYIKYLNQVSDNFEKLMDMAKDITLDRILESHFQDALAIFGQIKISYHLHTIRQTKQNFKTARLLMNTFLQLQSVERDILSIFYEKDAVMHPKVLQIIKDINEKLELCIFEVFGRSPLDKPFLNN